jgi:chromate transporter
MTAEKNYRLFLAFLKLGLTAFGGPAMVAHVKDLSVRRNQWIDEEAFKNGVALCQSIPGATVMQLVAYVGMKVNGIQGALFSYLGFGLPAFSLMLALSVIYADTHDLPKVASLFNGLQVIVVAIIAHAAYSFSKGLIGKYWELLIAALSAIVLWAGMNPFLVIILSAVISAMILRNDNPGTLPPVPQWDGPRLKDAAILLTIFVAGIAVLYFVDIRLFKLSLLMVKIDLFAFGGGFGSLPLMFQEVVRVNNWLDSKTFMEGIALGQMTPGPIVITATFVGYLLYGLPGAIVATISIFGPSFLLLITVSPYFDRLKASPYFIRATKGILASFAGLLFFMALKFAFAVHWDVIKVVLGSASFIALISKIDILYIVLAGSVISIFVF